MAKMGRPPIDIDWKDFDKLCHIQCTLEEIAGWFKCSVDTIENRVKQEYGVTFSEYFRQKRSTGRISLRRSQFQAAEKGNTTMLIWLGKQYLNQSEKLTTLDKTPEAETSQEERKARIELIKKMAKEIG